MAILVFNIIGIVMMISVFISLHLNIDNLFLPLIFVIGLFFFLLDNTTKEKFSESGAKPLKWYVMVLHMSFWSLGGLTGIVLKKENINLINLLFSNLYFVVLISFILTLLLVRRYYEYYIFK